MASLWPLVCELGIRQNLPLPSRTCSTEYPSCGALVKFEDYGVKYVVLYVFSELALIAIHICVPAAYVEACVNIGSLMVWSNSSLSNIKMISCPPPPYWGLPVMYISMFVHKCICNWDFLIPMLMAECWPMKGLPHLQHSCRLHWEPRYLLGVKTWQDINQNNISYFIQMKLRLCLIFFFVRWLFVLTWWVCLLWYPDEFISLANIQGISQLRLM